jgi:hypothetical protein
MTRKMVVDIFLKGFIIMEYYNEYFIIVDIVDGRELFASDDPKEITLYIYKYVEYEDSDILRVEAYDEDGFDTAYDLTVFQRFIA